MIRPFRDEVERYGHYSLAAESMYDHPFQWGSKRTGPDLARVGGRYSDEWHVQHLKDRAIGGARKRDAALRLPGRDRPERRRHGADLTGALPRRRALYKEDLEQANEDLKAQADPNADTADLIKRYPKAQVRDFDGNPDRLTEMDALVAYLQVLGTLVDVNAPAAQEALAKEKGR
jgi:cytochrome c oxidase cbb3-type subunit 2